MIKYNPSVDTHTCVQYIEKCSSLEQGGLLNTVIRKQTFAQNL